MSTSASAVSAALRRAGWCPTLRSSGREGVHVGQSRRLIGAPPVPVRVDCDWDDPAHAVLERDAMAHCLEGGGYTVTAVDPAGLYVTREEPRGA